MDKYKWLKHSFPVNILKNCLSSTDVVRNLGVLFYSKFGFQDLHRMRRFTHMTSIFCFAVCPPRISQGFKISKIVWDVLSLVGLDFLMSLRFLSLSL